MPLICPLFIKKRLGSMSYQVTIKKTKTFCT
nr:MAG TPA: hypothetical protein [Caudoviricetes sp.]